MQNIELTFPDILGQDMGFTDHRSDWVYRDLPRMKEEFFDLFLNIVGNENISWLTQAEYQEDGYRSRRGQLLVSPEGIERARAYNAAKAKG
jgi:hypothetical protein